MHINLTGHHVDITDALRDYTQEKMAKLERHFEHVNNIHVILTVEKQRHKAEATVHVSGGNGNLFAESIKDDMYASIDTLIDKLDRQVLKHKEKLVDHHQRDKIELAE